MVDIALIKELVNSMEKYVLQLEKATAKKDINEINELRTSIFELHNKIDGALRG
jgi:hypothetical protein